MELGERYVFHVLKTEIGPLTLSADGDALLGVTFGDRGDFLSRSGGTEWSGSPLFWEAARQFGEYFRGQRRGFDLPIRIKGTDFQRLVWDALRTIPYGETRTYAEIAAQIGRPGAARAVGGANHRNPLSIVVPCHRVVGADGTLVGFGGGLEVKQRLLEIEGASLADRGRAGTLSAPPSS